MRTKEEIFKDIQKVMSSDYAGYADKKYVNNPDQYNISNDMDDRTFEETIQEYLLDFQDGHLWFAAQDSSLPNRGFSVRRYEDALYVIDSPKEDRLEVGDKIIKIDGEDISTLAIRYRKRLEEEVPERQLWDSVIRRLSRIQFERDDNSFNLELDDYEPDSYQPVHALQWLNNKTAYIKITDFAEEEPIHRLVRENQDDLQQAENVIIDVRVNHGGNDAFYFPLLHYMFNRTLTFQELFADDEIMYTNYTERNCQLFIQELNDYLKQDLDKTTADFLKREIDTLKDNYGKGLLNVPEDEDYTIYGDTKPEHIYVLSDYYCGSSGDTFVSNAKKSPKVTVVGRPTMGIMDYFNVATIDYGEYEFSYGISKMDSRYSINGRGVEPDIYIPWTPDHVVEDKDLAYVKGLIKRRTNET